MQEHVIIVVAKLKEVKYMRRIIKKKNLKIKLLQKVKLI